jgi:LacI family transcriptional regulator
MAEADPAKMSAPRLSDIAKRAGVSVATVSIALNDSKTTRVSPAKRELIRSIADEIGYSPNELAKALSVRKTRLLGLMVPLRDPIFFNQFIAQALSGIQAAVMRRGYNLLIYSPSGRPGRTTRDQILESRFTDGLIFINTRSCSARDINETIHELDAAKIRFTMINSYYGRAAINYVGVDDSAVGRAAMRYLIAQGHRRIAFLSSSPLLPTHIHLLHGIRQQLREAGVELRSEHVGCTDYDQTKAFTILDGWMARRSTRPTAIFTADDTLLLHMYDYVEARQLTVPGDVSIVARANSASASGLRPRPTAFYIPTFEIGELAADILIDALEKPVQPPKRILLPFKFTEGKTT